MKEFRWSVERSERQLVQDAEEKFEQRQLKQGLASKPTSNSQSKFDKAVSDSEKTREKAARKLEEAKLLLKR